ncbi:hypothetical protein DL93DRAFT_2088354 [Clavulina sp. PMI_390]|nr:hypothetical protein DL93DRAFT_2088354 [Clavulina sp. PMI_390]
MHNSNHSTRAALRLDISNVESRLWKTAQLRRLLDALSEELDTERNQLLALKAKHHNSNAPVNRLPGEVLAQVFQLFRPSPTRDEHTSSIPHGTAFKLSVFRAKFCAVCSHWRNVIIADPTMWNVLYLAMDDSVDPVDYITWARLQLERSGSASLDLSVSLRHPAESCQPAYYALLREHLPRCQRLALLINYHIGARYLLLDLFLPNLQMLKILYTDDSASHLLLPPAAQARIATFTPISPCQTPALMRLAVNSDPFNSAPISWNLYTSNHNTLKLLSLSTGSDNLKDLFEFFAALTQLQHLSWDCNGSEDFETLDLPQPITLPNLLTLDIGGNRVALQALHTPNIYRFEFRADGREWDDYICTLGQVPEASGADGAPKAFKLPHVRFLDVSSMSSSSMNAVCDYIVPNLDQLEELSFYDPESSILPVVHHIVADRQGRNLSPLRAVSVMAPTEPTTAKRLLAPLLLDSKLTVCLYRKTNGPTYCSSETWSELKEALESLEGRDRIIFVDDDSKWPTTLTVGPWGEAPDM